MNAIATELAEHLSLKLNQISSSKRILIGVCGIPASGKTSLSHQIVRELNTILVSHNSDAVAICISQDGWHFTRATLDTFNDPVEAHARRGAAFTFDGVAFTKFVRGVSDAKEDKIGGPPLPNSSLKAPSFSHTLKDPFPDAIEILPHHKIILVEGLYTFLNIPPWNEAAKILDERWFVEVDFDEAKRRLVKRHVITGVAKNEEEALWRWDHNDLPNGMWLINHMLTPTRVISSFNDPSIADLSRME